MKKIARSKFEVGDAARLSQACRCLSIAKTVLPFHDGWSRRQIAGLNAGDRHDRQERIA